MRVNVATDYGAPGNGSSWAYAQIRNAYQAVKAAGGGEVFVPIGTYLMDQQLVVDSPHVRFIGEGWGSVLKAAGGQRLHGLFRVEAPATHTTFKNLKLDGNRASAGLETDPAIYSPQIIENLAPWLCVKRCEVTGSPRAGLGFGSGSAHLRYLDNWIHDNGSLLADGSVPGGGNSSAGGGAGIMGGDFAHSAMPFDVRIERNIFERNRRAGAGNQHEGSAAFVGCKSLRFIGNTCLDNWNNGGQLVDLNGGGVDCDWLIVDNEFMVTPGIEPPGAYTYGLELSNRGYQIRGNTFRGGRGPGVLLRAIYAESESGHAQIQGNVFEAQGGGVMVPDGVAGSRVVAVQVVNNRFRNMVPTGYGVLFQTPAVACASLDNDFSQAGYPAAFDILDQTGQQLVRRL